MTPRILWGLLLLTHAPLIANPEGGKVVAGTAEFQFADTAALSVKTTGRAIIEWDSFSINAKEATHFNQPSAASAVLNRVTGNDPSSILGSLTSNGSVYLINPRGIVFGKECVIDVGSLAVSTLDISNAQFLNGAEILFKGESTASIVNLGTIRAKSGNIIIAAHKIENRGWIKALHGKVALGAGHEILVQSEVTPSLYIKVSDIPAEGILDEGVIKALQVELQSVSSPHSLGLMLKGKVDALEVFKQGGEIFLSVENSNLQIEKSAQLNAYNGKITIEAKESFLTNKGSLKAKQGEIDISADKLFSNTGFLDVSGKKGGKIDISATDFITDAAISADGLDQAGSISIQASGRHIETSGSHIHANAALEGGGIRIRSGRSYFSSGTYQVNGQKGGTIDIEADLVGLGGAALDASGQQTGGVIKIEALSKIKPIQINATSILRAEAASEGKISLSSGFAINNKGKVSSKTILMKMPDSLLTAPLLGVGSGSCICSPPIEFIDPDASTGVTFGQQIFPLSTGNVAFTKPDDGLNATGAVYLYNGSTGKLISSLFGTNNNDQIGDDGLTAVANGNYVVSSPDWNTGIGAATWINGATGEDGTGATNSSVSASNSFLGNIGGDFVSGGGITLLSNGNCVISTPSWSSTNMSVGAVTWMDGTTGKDGNGNFGPVSDGITPVGSTANSIFGSSTNDEIGGFILPLVAGPAGHCIICSSDWNSVNTDVGAVTWMNGTTGKDGNGIFGPVSDGTTPVGSTANSIFGSSNNDRVGSHEPAALENGHCVIASADWSSTNPSVGAATWINGTTGQDGNGIFGPVSDGVTPVGSTANSIFGSSANDGVSVNRVMALPINSNCVILSSQWQDYPDGFGAATWMNGATGKDGASPPGFNPVSNGMTSAGMISPANSITGSSPADYVSAGGGAVLTNGHFVITSGNWAFNTGAATWMDGTTGKDATGAFNQVSNGMTSSGMPSPANSITGRAIFDEVAAGITALTNGNCVLTSPGWGNGVNTSIGAATWMNGDTSMGMQGRDANGNFGMVTPSNSIIGTLTIDQIGYNGAVALANGNCVIMSSLWNMGVGAATWMNGMTGQDANNGFNPVSAANSITGSITGDEVGMQGYLALADGNFVFTSPNWNNTLGAATWMNGTTGQDATGGFNPVSAANSLIGTIMTDFVGGGNTSSIGNENYVVVSPSWNASTSAITIGTNSTGAYCSTFGTINSNNSVIGPNTGANLEVFYPIAIDSVNQTFLYAYSNDQGIPGAFATRYANCIMPTPPSPAFILPKVPASGVHDYLVALSEPFARWLDTSWGGHLQQSPFPPLECAELRLYPASLVVFKESNSPQLQHKKRGR